MFIRHLKIWQFLFWANLLNGSIQILAFKTEWWLFFIVISTTLDQMLHLYFNLIIFQTSFVDFSFFASFSILIFSLLINECNFFIDLVALIFDLHKHWFLDKTRSLNIGLPLYLSVLRGFISINFLVSIKSTLLLKWFRIILKIRKKLLSKSARINALFDFSLCEFIIWQPYWSY